MPSIPREFEHEKGELRRAMSAKCKTKLALTVPTRLRLNPALAEAARLRTYLTLT